MSGYNAGVDSPILDPRYDAANLTDAINVAPYRTGRAAQLGIFIDTPIATTFVRIGKSEHELTVIPARARGGEPNLAMRPDTKGVVFAHIPHFPLDDAIGPADIQNISGFGPQAALQTVDQVVAEKLDYLRGRHDLTHSYLDWGALNGLVIDADGKEICDLYEKFEVTQPSFDFKLDTSSTDIAALNRAAKARLRKELRGTASTGVRVFAGPGFFDRYIGHAFVKENLKAYAGDTPNPNRDEIEEVFTFAGLTLERVDEEYPVRLPSGGVTRRKVIPDDEAIMVPLGTPFFKRYIAPPDTLTGANRAPDPATKIFVSTEDLPHDRGREIHTESNVLPICVRPELLTRFYSGS